MARFNEILVGRYNRALQKLFSMKGSVSLATMADEMMPVYVFHHGAENRYLEGWHRFAQFVSNGAVAAQNAAIRLRNPVGSNVIAVIEKIYVTNAQATADTPFLQLNALTTDLAQVFAYTGNARFDPRGQHDPNCILSNTNNVASIGGTKWQTSLATNSSAEVIVDEVQEFPLLPGDALQVVTTAVNVSLSVSIWWRERFLEDSERT